MICYIINITCYYYALDYTEVTDITAMGAYLTGEVETTVSSIDWVSIMTDTEH